MGMDGRERSRKYQVANYPLHNYNYEFKSQKEGLIILVYYKV